ncbi:MAG: 2-oxoacid:acceptor oxidoreductase family protein, partial [Nitrospirae bacterium]|nr:2-oxoacid:acceptor oxidoreductase family protein [Nitrospirota bacterium]
KFFVLGVKHTDGIDATLDPDVRPENAYSMRGHSVGGFGSVTTNKVIASVASDLFGLYAQAFPKYGSEKKGLPTNTYLTTTTGGKIMTHSELQQVEFVPLMDPNTWNMGNPLVGLQDGGIVFQHTDAESPEALWGSIPAWAKHFLLEHKIRFYGVDTIRIARESCKADESLIQRFQGIVLLGVFLRVTPYREQAGMSEEDLFRRVEEPLRQYFGKKGEAVLRENLQAVKKGYSEVVEVTRPLMEKTDPGELARGKAEWEQKGKDVNAFFI